MRVTESQLTISLAKGYASIAFLTCVNGVDMPPYSGGTNFYLS